VLTFMMLMVVVDVLLRNIFNSPIQGSHELVEFMMVLMVFLFFANTQKVKGNVSVTMITSRISGKAKAATDVFVYLVCLFVFIILTTQAYEYFHGSLVRGDLSPALFLPRYPFRLVATIGLFVATLVYLIDLLVAIAKLFEKPESDKNLQQN
jgi:TRAP-type transport system small permease protein